MARKRPTVTVISNTQTLLARTIRAVLVVYYGAH